VPRVTLPDGARAVAMDGTDRYTAGPGDKVSVNAAHAQAIRTFGQSRPAGERFAFGTRRGRYCGGCARTWNAWSVTCPRCGADTVPDEATA
jgi:hypothetical protein